jgi:L-alanine-DL-glutamate epimerase-like enolase superfamily enzyme
MFSHSTTTETVKVATPEQVTNPLENRRPPYAPPVRVARLETLFCDAGWRPWIFLKATTDDGLVGWAEVTDSHGSPRGLVGIVEDLSPLVVGRDARAVEAIYWELYRATRQSPGSVIQKALAGIENALLDVKAKALGVPVYELFGGPTRDSVTAYWSHCGTTRARAWEVTGTKKLVSYDDVAELGREVVARGFRAFKTNIVVPGDEPQVLHPGFHGPGLDRNPSRAAEEALRRLLDAFQEGTEGKAEPIVDLNFNFTTEGFLRVARALEQRGLMWLEVDCFDAAALAHVRRGTPTPICSGENLYTNRGFRPFFEAGAMDIASVDVIWNGFAQSKKIADLAETFEVNCAPHNYYSHLATFISAQWCAAIPNVRILEVDVDDVPWKDELTTAVPKIEDGELSVPAGPGWGADVNEDVLLAHPWPGGSM